MSTAPEQPDTPSRAGVGPGTHLDDFHLIERIGRGAMGEVFLARQRSLDRMVAVKILAPELTSTREQVDLFQREMRHLARLHHPNIVTAFYAGHAAGAHYLAMSYVAGETLYTRIERRGWLDEEEALCVVYKMAIALRYAWEEHGLIHRDIKPANIMIDGDGEIKVTDLGISKHAYEDKSAAPERRIIGTPQYMSPEQARGEFDLDFRSDMYSIGVTLFQMLSGRVPFDATTIHEILDQHKRERPPVLRHERAELSPATQRLLDRLLAKRPEDRYDSWDALLTAARDALHHDPRALPPAATATPPLPPSSFRRPVRWILVVLLLIVVTIGWERMQAREKLQHAGVAADKLRVHILQQQQQRELDRRLREVMDHLDRRAMALIHEGRLRDAANIYLDYDGPWKEESAPERHGRARALEF